MNQTDHLRNHHNRGSGDGPAAKEDLVSFTRNNGFITQPPEDPLLQPFAIAGGATTLRDLPDGGKDELDHASDSQLLATSQSNNVLSSKSRVTGNPIRFIQQRGGMEYQQNSRSSSVIPFYNRSKFGDRINDHVRMLRKSWDRYLEESGGANLSGPASKLLYGQSSLKQNNYIKFDK